ADCLNEGDWCADWSGPSCCGEMWCSCPGFGKCRCKK
uniref:Delta-amaurobitoxin-Pl1c n=1 Tax=Pireneitega luctuosa TaxID=185217 RepID=TXDP3_PIRLC|nr:RecName: Full=Delta-amaurobitoxin-Pl1c; Short=Delta-AMATX-Pl1c; AltName: Full=Delta-palutoxin IT3; Short=Delta-paluIT3 [Pireneitega luctuosa]